MKRIYIAGGCALFAGLLLSGCKKAETPAPAAEPTTPPVAQEAAPAQAAKPAPPEPPKDAVVMKVKWPVGAHYVFRMDLDQHSTNHIPQLPKPMQQDTTIAMTYAVAVLGETPEHGREIEMEFMANEMDVKMGEQTVISFDSKEKASDENPMAAPFRRMIGSKIKLQLDANGKVDKVIGLDEWRQKLVGENGGPAGAMLTQQFSEGYFRQILGFGTALPDKPVQVGDTWPYHLELPTGQGKIDTDTTVRFKGWEERQQRKCAALDVTGTFQGSIQMPMAPMGKMTIENGKATGSSWFDPELGMLVESVIDQSMKMIGQMPAPVGGNRSGGEFIIEIGQKVTLTLVEAGKVEQ